MDNSRSLKLKCVSNARELGGYIASDGRTIKRGLLLRTGRLDEADTEDIASLCGYNVGAVIDFRMPAEAETAPDPDLSGANYFNLSILNEAEIIKQDDEMSIDLKWIKSDPIRFLRMALDAKVIHPDMYIDFLRSDEGKAGFARFFRILLDTPTNKAVLWHCTSGKDRTGVAAMLILSALGVDEETIIYDYLLTNEFNSERIMKTTIFLMSNLDDDEKPRIPDMLVVLDGVNKSYMQNAVDYLKSEYGSVMGYIKTELGISDDETEILKKRYLE